MSLRTEPVGAQIGPREQTQILYPQYSQIQFAQDLNIFDWIYTFHFQENLPNDVAIEVHEEYHATLQSLTFQDRWKDNQNLSVSLGYPLASSLTLQTKFTSHLLSDPLAGFDNDVTFHSGTAEVVYRPQHNVLLAPKVSSKWQTQVEQADHGFGIGLDARVFNLEFDSYQSDLFVLAQRDFFPQRKNTDVQVRYEIQREFHDAAADTLVIFYNRLRRDSFDADASGIFVRNLSQSRRGFENRLRYTLADDATILVRNSVQSDLFEVRNLKPEATEVRKDDAGFESRNSLRLQLQKSQWTSSIGWNFRTRSRDDRRPQESVRDPFGTRHPSLGFDTDETFTSLELKTGFRVSGSDSVALFASASKFQFDTSDTTNPNDHDQLQWHLTFSHGHFLGNKVQLWWRASAFLNHFVYIASKFSSGNNWERVFQLSPQIVYQPNDKLLFRQAFTVRAKYQTYDFDDPETSNRNIVNRLFVISNSSQYSFSEALSLQLGVNVELAEQGKLFYDLWRQRLALSWQNQEVQIQLKQKIGHKFWIKPGAQIFHQTRWNHTVARDGTLSKIVRDTHTNVGPTLEVSYRPSSAVQFAFWGNVQVVSSSGRPTDQLNNFDVNMNWFF